MEKTVSIEGVGFLEIDDDNQIFIYEEDGSGPINLAYILSKYNGHEIHFGFMIDEAI